jgi:hypothetical protein
MLNFTPFYDPLGDGSSLGEAYRDWWDYIAAGGLSPSEIYWHLGMVLLGDPTLMPAMHMLGVDEGTPDAQPGVSIAFSSNPCTGSVTVNLNVESGTVQLFDLSGRLVLTGNLSDSSCNLDLEGLGSGCYMVRAVSEQGTDSQLLTVIR